MERQELRVQLRSGSGSRQANLASALVQFILRFYCLAVDLDDNTRIQHVLRNFQGSCYKHCAFLRILLLCTNLFMFYREISLDNTALSSFWCTEMLEDVAAHSSAAAGGIRRSPARRHRNMTSLCCQERKVRLGGL